MDDQRIGQVYLCPRCLQGQEQAGDCPRCGEPLLTCRPGDADDPCRKPIMDRHGRVRSRAPLWWLRHSVEELARRFENKK